MSEKTPFQLMREQHQSRIQAQKQAANYRAYAFKHGIAFVNQADLHAKMAEIESEQQRVVLACKQEKERVIEERKQRILDKADRLEVYFKDEVVYMKDKDEGWDGMLSEDEGWELMLPKGDAIIINETTNNKGNK